MNSIAKVRPEILTEDRRSGSDLPTVVNNRVDAGQAKEGRGHRGDRVGFDAGGVRGQLAAFLHTGVADVDEGSPAEQAGMKRGLVINQVGRYPVTSSKQIEDLLAPINTGSVVDFSVGAMRRVRGQTIQQVQSVTLTAR